MTIMVRNVLTMTMHRPVEVFFKSIRMAIGPENWWIANFPADRQWTSGWPGCY